MPDAYTFDQGNGNIKTFKNRREMYDHMIDQGHAILEGDDAPRFAEIVSLRSDEKAMKIAEKISNESGHTSAIAVAKAVLKRPQTLREVL